MTELFATGIQMGESPRWHDGRFWMCDWLAGEVLAFDTEANREVVVRIDGLPFSIDWLPDGRLVATTPGGLSQVQTSRPTVRPAIPSTRSWSMPLVGRG